MDIHENYHILIAPHLAIHPYRKQAEKIALESFLAFDEDEKARFFVFFKQICQEKSSTYQFLSKVKAGEVIPAKHLRYLLSAMPMFLDTEKQMEVLLLEVLDSIQTHKLGITANHSLVVNVEKAFGLFSKYLAGIYYLSNTPSIWLADKMYDTQDRLEVIQAVMYVYVIKLKGSVAHFKKDLQIIADKTKFLSKKIIYFIELLGVEVEILDTHYDLNKLYLYDDIELPQFAGKFAQLLQTYIATELASENHQLAIREMQKAVLDHDLGIALTHYKNNNTRTSRADIAFALQGGAGIVKLEIRSWLTRWLAGKFKWWEMAIPVTILMAILMRFNSELPSFLFVPFVLILTTGLQNMRKDPRLEEEKEKEAKNLEKAHIRASFTAQYQQLILDRQAEKYYKVLNQSIFEDMYLNICSALEASIGKVWGKSPEDLQNAYSFYLANIHELESENIGYIADFKGTEQDKETCLQAIKYLLLQQYDKSHHRFNKIMQTLMQERLEATYYSYLLSKECTIYTDFYPITENAVFYHLGSQAQASDYYEKPNYLAIYEAKGYTVGAILKPRPILQGDYAQALHEWLDKEMEVVTQNNLENELAKITQYAVLVEQSKTTNHLVILPFLLEGEEGILYV